MMNSLTLDQLILFHKKIVAKEAGQQALEIQV
jgi:hypothetical protein